MWLKTSTKQKKKLDLSQQKPLLASSVTQTLLLIPQKNSCLLHLHPLFTRVGVRRGKARDKARDKAVWCQPLSSPFLQLPERSMWNSGCWLLFQWEDLLLTHSHSSWKRVARRQGESPLPPCMSCGYTTLPHPPHKRTPKIPHDAWATLPSLTESRIYHQEGRATMHRTLCGWVGKDPGKHRSQASSLLWSSLQHPSTYWLKAAGSL